jgi:HEAT repeat protein
MRFTLTGLLVALLLSFASLGHAQSPAKFLGKDLPTWQQQLASGAPAVRHEAAWALAQLGTPARAELLSAANHQDQVVRYWAVHGLGKVLQAAGADAADREQVNQQLRKLLQDEAAAPRLAAAAVLAHHGSLSVAMPVLIAGLGDPQDSAGVQAASTLRSLGKQAAPARDKLEQVQKTGGEYVKRLATQTLQLLQD